MDARFYLVQSSIAERQRDAELERLLRHSRAESFPRPPARVRLERFGLGRLFSAARRPAAAAGRAGVGS